jgi:hypothetical protein
MKIYYSKSTYGFYNDSIHNSIPDDAVSISEETYNKLLNEQSAGKRILPNLNGFPEAFECSTVTGTWESVRHIRNVLLAESDWTQLPDVPDSIKSKWLLYRQELRDITNKYKTPIEVNWPKKP